jgi:hypothetical protein
MKYHDFSKFLSAVISVSDLSFITFPGQVFPDAPIIARITIIPRKNPSVTFLPIFTINMRSYLAKARLVKFFINRENTK